MTDGIAITQRASGAPAPQPLVYNVVRHHGFADVLREHRRSRPDELAAIDGELHLTWRELDVRVNRLRTALAGHGVVAGDRLLWFGQNSVKLFELILAAAKIGAIAVPANWRLSPAEGRAIVDDLDPRIVFWQQSEIGEAQRAIRDGADRGRIWCQHDGEDGDCFDALLAAGADEDMDADHDPGVPLLGIYTAAFDGRAGAALLSHNALILQALLSAQGQAIDERSRYLVSGPMFHIGVLMGAFGAYLRGAVQIFVPRIEADAIMRTIDQHRVTHAFLPPPIAKQMIERASETPYDLSSLFENGDPANWRTTIVMPPHAPAALHPGGYGQTEVSGYLSQLWLGGSGAGRPNPLTQVRIVDASGNDVDPGQTGEIVVRGPMVMSGYYDRPALNASRSIGGWHHTHDLGRRNPDGSIVFVGPKSRMIKSGVENIYPAEVENCLAGHTAVAGVCVIGVPDPVWAQNVKAIVVLQDGASVTEEELAAYCRLHLASYKKPKLWVFAADIPRTPAGMIDREAADRLHGGGGYPSRGG